MILNAEVRLPNKFSTPKNIGEGLKELQRKLCKEALFLQYEKNKNISIISDPIPIKYLPEGTKAPCSIIAPSIKLGDCSDAWNFFTPL